METLVPESKAELLLSARNKAFLFFCLFSLPVSSGMPRKTVRSTVTLTLCSGLVICLGVCPVPVLHSDNEALVTAFLIFGFQANPKYTTVPRQEFFNR